MPKAVFYFWKKVPFIRLLIPFIAGIIIQWEEQQSIFVWIVLLICASILLISFFFIPFFGRFRLSVLNGIAAGIAFVSFGALLTWQKDIRNNHSWFGHSYKDEMALLVTLDEPPVEKTKSIKADAIVSYLQEGNEFLPVKGKIILYFKKDSSLKHLAYGSQIVFRKSLQEIKNSGNPGGFDYKRYSLFHDITHQVYLKTGEFEILPVKKEMWFRKFLYTIREKVLNILRNNIKGEKESGLAEALLIGYKDDLDKPLVQSYTNTGVVHIIAISGLHLGLIYWLLVLLFKPLQKKKKLVWLRSVLIIAGLWLFSFLAGGQPSVLRSALMFSTIILGESFSKRSNIYNTLAFSAFALLCINPFWLWDVGFQLSYAAVLSIVIFMKPIYNWFYLPNKILDHIWKLNAITLAAQIFTLPVSIYHFHQFPVYFFLTNFLAVPLSGMILMGEILLCVVSPFPIIAAFAGKILTWMIWLMNSYIERIESIKFSLLDGFQISIVQTILLVISIAGISYWLLEQNKTGFKAGLIALLGFVTLRSYSIIRAENQKKIIVYNIPLKNAIDFVQGKNYFFLGDSSLLEDDFARNFHLKPSRILYRITQVSSLNNLYITSNYVHYNSKQIILLNKSTSFINSPYRTTIDLLILSGNPRAYVKKLVTALNIKQVVIDGSVPPWRANYWKKDCDSLHIPYHDVTTDGAFVMNL
jgi:competence protein ComEC